MMNRDAFEAIGDKHKKIEAMYYNYFLPELPIVVRLDGRAFHTFTKGLRRPFDNRMSKMMIEVTKELVYQTHAKVGYTQSDEISLVFAPATDPLFGGRQSKIETTLAAIASAKFNQLLPIWLPDKINDLPTFDARAIQYPTKEMAIESLVWRETDATRNSISMAAQAHFSHNQLQKKNNKVKLDMLNEIGVNWNDYPVHFKRGEYVKRIKIEQMIPDKVWDKIPEKNRPLNRIVARSVVDTIELDPIESMFRDNYQKLEEIIFG
jgi:tRNA(His) 5'-end guanylyltransferase